MPEESSHSSKSNHLSHIKNKGTIINGKNNGNRITILNRGSLLTLCAATSLIGIYGWRQPNFIQQVQNTIPLPPAMAQPSPPQQPQIKEGVGKSSSTEDLTKHTLNLTVQELCVLYMSKGHSSSSADSNEQVTKAAK